MRYLNPKDQPKETWLLDNGLCIPAREGEAVDFVQTAEKAIPDFWKTHYVVCMINNGKFRAAAVCEDIEGVRHCDDPGDPRPRYWFVVKKATADPEIRDMLDK